MCVHVLPWMTSPGTGYRPVPWQRLLDSSLNLRARFNERLREIESESTQIREMLRVLTEAPRLLAKTPVFPVERAPASQQTKSGGGRQLQNRNVTELVRKYIDDFNNDEVIKPNAVVEYLTQNGVKGKHRSLYSATCVILKKETQPGKDGRPPRLSYEKSIGFLKRKREPP